MPGEPRLREPKEEPQRNVEDSGRSDQTADRYKEAVADLNRMSDREIDRALRSK